MRDRIFYESEICAQIRWTVERRVFAPSAVDSRLAARVAALQAALKLPRDQLPLLLFLAKRHHDNPKFSVLFNRLPASRGGYDSTPALQFMKWFSINHVDGVALVSINGDIGGFGIGADDFERELGDCQTVELFIDSFGGDSLCAMKVYDLLRPRNVSALVTGECFSAAVTIFLAASRRSMLPKAEIMVHQPVNFVCGSSAFLRQSADGLDRLTARIKQAYCEATGQPAETIDRWFNGADFHFDPAKAISDGLAHEVVNQTQRALPAPAQGFDAPGSQTRQPTADESFFYDLLAGLGRINVSDKDKFAARLGGWLNTSVGQRDKTL